MAIAPSLFSKEELYTASQLKKGVNTCHDELLSKKNYYMVKLKL